jgi:hypothetical protein
MLKLQLHRFSDELTLELIRKADLKGELKVATGSCFWLGSVSTDDREAFRKFLTAAEAEDIAGINRQQAIDVNMAYAILVRDANLDGRFHLLLIEAKQALWTDSTVLIWKRISTELSVTPKPGPVLPEGAHAGAEIGIMETFYRWIFREVAEETAVKGEVSECRAVFIRAGGMMVFGWRIQPQMNASGRGWERGVPRFRPVRFFLPPSLRHPFLPYVLSVHQSQILHPAKASLRPTPAWPFTTRHHDFPRGCAAGARCDPLYRGNGRRNGWTGRHSNCVDYRRDKSLRFVDLGQGNVGQANLSLLETRGYPQGRVSGACPDSYHGR